MLHRPSVVIPIVLLVILLWSSNTEAFTSSRLKSPVNWFRWTNQTKRSSFLNSASPSAIDPLDKLSSFQTMAAGAVSRSIAQAVMHPVNAYKTILQTKDGHGAKICATDLWRGADAQLLLSIPHGALYFFVIDRVRSRLSRMLPGNMQSLGDFASSTISLSLCTVISNPQSVITDRLMAGVYKSFPEAVTSIYREKGLIGFYHGWWPALVQRVPSYGLTWVLFQEMKRWHKKRFEADASAEANFIYGAVAGAAGVCVMMPVDTIKTRMVTQMLHHDHPEAYRNMLDCGVRMLREEGVGSLYRALPPRLLSVVPTMAVQFGIYEVMRHYFERSNASRRNGKSVASLTEQINNESEKIFGEVAADTADIAATRKQLPRLKLLSLHDWRGGNSVQLSKTHSSPSCSQRKLTNVNKMNSPLPFLGGRWLYGGMGSELRLGNLLR